MNHSDRLRHDYVQLSTRRHFLKTCPTGLGAMWLASQAAAAAASGGADKPSFQHDPTRPLSPLDPPRPATAKRVIFLHMAGAPSQLELFDYKPNLQKFDGKDCPASFMEGKRFAFIRGVPKLLGPQFAFAQHGESGAWVSDRLPEFAKVVDSVAFVRSMQTDQFNHAPAQLLLHTGNAQLGYPSLGSWLTYGLGSENDNLPGYVVLVSGGRVPSAGKSVWGSGFLPGVYQGIQCRGKGDPVLFLSDPEGVGRPIRSAMVDTISRINRQTYEQIGDPETVTRIAQYEMAFRMQMAATEATDLGQETAEVHQAYGVQPGKESFANNCLLARRLVERGVRFVQLFDWGWDAHGAAASEAINKGFKNKCAQIDRPITALLNDLKRSGLLEDTLVVWGGEFGRTPMRENRGGKEMTFVGRDHHADAFTMWLAGGGVRSGVHYGETDELGFEAVENPVQVRDLHATLLKLMGFDHQKLSFPLQGLDQRLTGVKPARVVEELIG
ncbi:DUF1501 domain-containing protein [Roseimaritima ulvae]|uniref:Sulfatase n=1 Tax=Roseimaritima ulvae TaxID=980254 RepID=A0A5B9QZV7_9BACT|nr:DUF1501 domain-containing protein [Roseimaritima ulvae]QEG42696.1 hypothetical protein UC8_47380 [Roseimaritima ulvae]